VTAQGTARRELVAAVLLCLVGASLVLLAAGRTWATVHVPGTGPLPGRAVDVTGAELAAALPALGLVGLSGVVAVAATRGWGRVPVGLVLAATGLGVLALAAPHALAPAGRARSAVDGPGAADAAVAATAWPYVGLAGALLLLVAGVLVAVRGRAWSVLGRRYERPGERPQASAPGAASAPSEQTLWDALDRGEDPTFPDPGTR
jgi:uncharacterized membrane protein (TIGR02234 family)